MTLDPALLTAIGDVFLNLSAGWFGAAVIIPGTGERDPKVNAIYIVLNIGFGLAALAFGYRLRIIGV